MMKIALVCPHFPPDACGVGDYTSCLASEIDRRGHSVSVWTARTEPKVPYPGKINVATVSAPWGPRALERISSELTAWKPDAVLLQYTPFLWAPSLRGIQPFLPAWVSSLRTRLNCSVTLVAHELHYPVGLSPDRLFIGTPQLGVFLALAAASEKLIFTYEVPWRRYGILMPWKRHRMAWVPVGANVQPQFPPKRDPRTTCPKDHKVLVQFGGLHPSKQAGHSLQALIECQARIPQTKCELVFLGAPAQEVSAVLEKQGRRDLAGSVRGTGYLSATEISEWIFRADLVLAPFVDGISTRRGSVMAALAHGRPTLTTRAFHTEPSLDWESFCALTAAHDEREFGVRAADILANPECAEALGAMGRQRYEMSFSWPVIANRILEFACDLDPPGV